PRTSRTRGTPSWPASKGSRARTRTRSVRHGTRRWRRRARCCSRCASTARSRRCRRTSAGSRPRRWRRPWRRAIPSSWAWCESRSGASSRSSRSRSPAARSMALATRTTAAVDRVVVSAYTVPTDEPESDGTLDWDSTTLVVVELRAGGETGLGYTYGPTAVAALIDTALRPIVDGSDAFAPAYTYVHLCRPLRNA